MLLTVAFYFVESFESNNSSLRRNATVQIGGCFVNALRVAGFISNLLLLFSFSCLSFLHVPNRLSQASGAEHSYVTDPQI